jgi:peptidoglycan biosynthesis protein MviN/MurJ (putative lipid II flippase)
MERTNFALGKINYMICGVSLLIIIIGFFLMTGSATTIEGGFDPDIFSTRRIVVAPMVCFFGFLLMIVGILYPNKKEDELKTNIEKANN